MGCSASFVQRWSRLLSSNVGYKLPVPKHHIWMLNRPFLTSKINERGKGLHKELTSQGYKRRNSKDPFNEVQSVLYNSNASIIVFIYITNQAEFYLLHDYKMYLQITEEVGKLKALKL